jgi:hypothetical protein
MRHDDEDDVNRSTAEVEAEPARRAPAERAGREAAGVGFKPAPDSDRAAILARRKQFIALALSGLTTTAACDKEAPSKGGKSSAGEQADTSKPQPCLTAQPEPPPPEPPPQPCLKVPPQPEPPPEPEIPPQPCLSFPVEPAPEPEPQPQPCLKKAMPD